MYGVPNGLIDYEFVVMAIDVSGAGHTLPYGDADLLVHVTICAKLPI
jgi:hypothetical protein